MINTGIEAINEKVKKESDFVKKLVDEMEKLQQETGENETAYQKLLKKTGNI